MIKKIYWRWTDIEIFCVQISTWISSVSLTICCVFSFPICKEVYVNYYLQIMIMIIIIVKKYIKMLMKVMTTLGKILTQATEWRFCWQSPCYFYFLVEADGCEKENQTIFNNFSYAVRRSVILCKEAKYVRILRNDIFLDGVCPAVILLCKLAAVEKKSKCFQ